MPGSPWPSTPPTDAQFTFDPQPPCWPLLPRRPIGVALDQIHRVASGPRDRALLVVAMGAGDKVVAAVLSVIVPTLRGRPGRIQAPG